MAKIHYRDTNENWETPPKLFGALSDVFRFNFDLAANPENAVCKDYFSANGIGAGSHGDALDEDWISGAFDGPRYFGNPPYGSFSKTDRHSGSKPAAWIERAIHFTAHVVLLVPFKAETKWAHRMIEKNKFDPDIRIWIFRGRIPFYQNGIKSKAAGSFASALLIFGYFDVSNDEIADAIIKGGFRGQFL